MKIFEKNYSELSIWGKNKDNDKLSESYFWKIYSQVSDDGEIKISNRNYLFIRVITIEFLLIFNWLVIFSLTSYSAVLNVLKGISANLSYSFASFS